MSIESLKRVLLATKSKARGMRTDKLKKRLATPFGDAKPEEKSIALGEEEAAPEVELEVEPEATDEAAPELSEEEKAAALEAIRALIKRA